MFIYVLYKLTLIYFLSTGWFLLVVGNSSDIERVGRFAPSVLLRLFLVFGQGFKRTFGVCFFLLVFLKGSGGFIYLN